MIGWCFWGSITLCERAAADIAGMDAMTTAGGDEMEVGGGDAYVVMVEAAQREQGCLELAVVQDQ